MRRVHISDEKNPLVSLENMILVWKYHLSVAGEAFRSLKTEKMIQFFCFYTIFRPIGLIFRDAEGVVTPTGKLTLT